MKKEEVCVLIDSEEKRLRALDILKKAGEEVFEESFFLDDYDCNSFHIGLHKDGVYGVIVKRKHEITIDQLEDLLLPNYVVKDVHLTIEELKEQAEKIGFELVEKKREIKVGDFGVFWNTSNGFTIHDFLKEIEVGKYFCKDDEPWDNFRHLTDEEKEKIQNNW